MDLERYLKRIRYHGSPSPNVRTLRNLHYHHLLSVPFENLDIHTRQPIVLNEESFYRKIVLEGRGGYCYELNGLFTWLLRRIGFKVAMLNARVARKDSPGKYGPAFDHMTLSVELSDERWLADVGFGDSFTKPIRLDYEGRQSDGRTNYKLDGTKNGRVLNRWNDHLRSWEPQYIFTLKPHKLADYKSRNEYQQRSPQSHFTKNRMISQLTPLGRTTLTDTKLVQTRAGKGKERRISGRREFARLLWQNFHIRLSQR